ncbi:hypothetical protein GGR70_001015 [Xanthomonas campestris]|uniref:hypothetical protein n=1 Tax=Xanthomonas campestris TaxID=339 RepID=UPI0021670B88|nr:hypothetical protein [Xanthomonas campestris]MCS3846080.1 hypothetical protein [Xanthomonas campestris]
MYVRRALRWWAGNGSATASLSNALQKTTARTFCMDASIGTLIGAARSGCAICD